MLLTGVAVVCRVIPLLAYSSRCTMHGARVVWETKDMLMAAENDRFEAVKWLHENAPPAAFKGQQKILWVAVKRGNIAMAEWVCQWISSEPNAEIVRVVASLAFSNNTPLILDDAIIHGQVESAKWLLECEVGDSVSLFVFKDAGENGHFSAVKWAALHHDESDRSVLADPVDEAAWAPRDCAHGI